MAWIVQVPPSPRHPKPRWQVRYQDDTRERSAGIYPSPKAAETVRKRIERGLPALVEAPTDGVDATKAQTCSATMSRRSGGRPGRRSIPTRPTRPASASRSASCPSSATPPSPPWTPTRSARGRPAWSPAGLRPGSVNSYLSLLGTILNAAVDSDYLADSPLMRRSRAGRVAAAKNLPVTRREVWVTRSQLDTLGYAIAPRYQALVTVAALTGMRWGELAALRWDDLRLDRPLDDGAVAGPGRLHVTRAFSDPRRSGNGRMKGPKSEAGRRTIALDQETCNTLHQHREQFGDELHGLVFTTPGGSRGRGGPLAANNFRRVWLRALE